MSSIRKRLSVIAPYGGSIKKTSLVAVDMIGTVPLLGTIECIKLDAEKRRSILRAMNKADSNSLIQELRMINNNGFDIEICLDDLGTRILHLAVFYKDITLICELLSRGADPSIPNRSGISPIDLAKILHDSNAIANYFDNDISYLDIYNLLESAAFKDRDITFSGWRIERNSDVLIPFITYENDSKLPDFTSAHERLYAGVYNNNNIISYDTMEETERASLLFAASYRGIVRIVCNLLKLGVSSNLVDFQGLTPLHYACLNGHLSIVELLCEYDAKIDASCLKAPKISDDANYNSGVWLYSLKDQDLISATHLGGMTPIICAAYNGHNEIISILVSKYKCSIDDSSLLCPISALMMASWRGFPETVNLLINLGATLSNNYSPDWFRHDINILQGRHVTTRAIENESTKRFFAFVSPNIANPIEAEIDREYLVIKELLQTIDPSSKFVQPYYFERDFKEFDYALLKEPFKFSGRRSTNSAKFTLDENENIKKFITSKLSLESDDPFYKYVDRISLKIQKYATFLDARLLRIQWKMLTIIKIASVAFKNNSTDEKSKIVSISLEIITDLIQTEKEVQSLQETIFTSQENGFNKSLECVLCTSLPLKDIFCSIATKLKKLSGTITKNFQVKIKIMMGVWPPENALFDLVESGINLCNAASKIVQELNLLGVWNIGTLYLESEDDCLTSDTETTRITNYSEYKRLEKQKELQAISSTNETDDALQACLVELNNLETEFLKNLEELINSVSEPILLLLTLKNEGRKSEYVAAASQIETKIEFIISEILKSELLDLSSETIVQEMANGENIRKIVSESASEIIKESEQIVHKAKIASGVWPPPAAADDMISAAYSTVGKLKVYIEKVRQIMEVVKTLIARERLKWLRLRKGAIQGEKLKTMLNQFQDLRFEEIDSGNNLELKKVSKQIDQNWGELSVEEHALLQDPSGDLVFDENKNIKGGKLVSILNELTFSNDYDVGFLNAFLLTHQSFTTSNDLLSLIISRFNLRPPNGLNQRQFELYMAKKILVVKLKCFLIIKTWVESHFENFTQNNSNLLKKLKIFIEQTLALEFASFARQLGKILNEKVEGIEKQKIFLLDQQQFAPTLIIPKCFKKLAAEELRKCLRCESNNILHFPPIEVARQLTLIDSEIFIKIQPRECLGQAWGKKDRLQTAPNISFLIQHTNAVTMWIATIVLHEESLKNRLKLMQFFLKILEICFINKNFSSCTSIIAAFVMGPIKRLRQTWQKLKGKFSNLFSKFEEIRVLLDPKGSYSAYRRHLTSCAPPLIPFLGVYLTDLTFIEDGNSDTLPNSTFINIEKRRKIAVVIKQIQRYQLLRYAFQPYPGLFDFIKADIASISKNEEELYEMSRHIEPPPKD